MARPRGNPNPGMARLGKPLPQLTCVRCLKTKSAAQFPKRGGPTYESVPPTSPRRYDKQCKLCKKPAPVGTDRADLTEPKHSYKKPKRRKRSDATGLSPAELKQITRIETRVKSMLYLSEKGCEKCGERDPRKLEYDHKDPSNKHRGISRIITDGYSWASAVLRAEIRKCRILCANCHRVHIIKQQGYYASPKVKETLRDIATKHGFKP